MEPNMHHMITFGYRIELQRGDQHHLAIVDGSYLLLKKDSCVMSRISANCNQSKSEKKQHLKIQGKRKPNVGSLRMPLRV